VGIRQRWCRPAATTLRANAAPLRDVADWLHPFERFWRQRLRALADLLDEQPE
jgi:hypothetical protein